MKFPERHKLSSLDDYLEMQADQFKVIGRSIAGVETVFSIPQFNLTLDIGRSPHFAFANDFLALSHWHMDHAGGVAYALGLRTLNSLPALNIVVPEEKYESTERFLKELHHVSETEIDYKVHSAKNSIEIKKNIFLESIPSNHCTASTGYGVVVVKNKLKPKFKGIGSQEIVKAKERGIEVSEDLHDLVLAYSGDCTQDFFKTKAIMAGTLFMECSFFHDDDNQEKIKKYGHTHINDWVKFADQIQSETVIMFHTSQRYTVEEIKSICQKKLPAQLLERLIIFR